MRANEFVGANTCDVCDSMYRDDARWSKNYMLNKSIQDKLIKCAPAPMTATKVKPKEKG